MIKNSLDPEQKLAVGKEEYKIIIEKSLVSIYCTLPCLLMYVNDSEHSFFFSGL